jgi:hypothetical protein
MPNNCCKDEKSLEQLVRESLDSQNVFFEEITKKAKELKDLLVNYIEIYNVENEIYSDIKKLIGLL